MREPRTLPACLNCGATFDREAISAKLRFAKCSHCGALHNVAAWFRHEPLESDIPVSLPLGLTYSETPQGARLSLMSAAARPVASHVVSMFIGMAIAGAALGLLMVLLSVVSSPASAGKSPLTLQLITLSLVIGATALVAATYKFRLLRKLPVLLGLKMEAVITVGTEGVRFNYTSARRRFSGSLGLGGIKGVVGVERDGRYRIKVVDNANVQYVVASDVLFQEACETALYLIEHAIRKAMTAGKVQDRPGTQEHPDPWDRVQYKGIGASQVACFGQVQAPARASVRRLQCKGCGAPIRLNRINRDERLGTCGYCGLVQDVSTFLRVARPTQRKLVLPRGLTLHDSTEGMTIAERLSEPIREHNVLLLGLAAGVIIGTAACAAMAASYPELAPILLVLLVVSSFLWVAYDRTRIDVTEIRAVMNRHNLRRFRVRRTVADALDLQDSPRQRADPEGFTLPISDVKAFIPQAYETGDGTLQYAVFAEDANGRRHVVTAALTYSRSAFVLAERLAERHRRLLAEAA